MRSLLKGALLLGVSVAWLVPGVQAWQVLDRMHGLEVLPDAVTIRHGLDALGWTLALMAVATVVWVLQLLSERKAREEGARLQLHVHEAQGRVEREVEQLVDVLRRRTAELQGDFGNFTAVGTRLRSALETRLSGIESLLQRQHEAQVQAFAQPSTDTRVEERLAALEQATDAAMRELGVTVVHKLRALEADLYDRDQRAMTDFGSLDLRLSDDAQRWEAACGAWKSASPSSRARPRSTAPR